MQRLKHLRSQYNITQERLGKLLGVAGNTIGQYEKGKRQPDINLLIKLANYFNVTVDYLIGNDKQQEISLVQQAYTVEQQKCIDMLLMLDEVKLGRLESYLTALTETESTFTLNKMR